MSCDGRQCEVTVAAERRRVECKQACAKVDLGKAQIIIRYSQSSRLFVTISQNTAGRCAIARCAAPDCRTGRAAQFEHRHYRRTCRVTRMGPRVLLMARCHFVSNKALAISTSAIREACRCSDGSQCITSSAAPKLSQQRKAVSSLPLSLS